MSDIITEKEFNEIFSAWCNDIKQQPTREMLLNFKQVIEKKCNATKFVLRSSRVGLNTVNAITRILMDKKTLTKLDLHENVIRDKGVKAVVDLLRENNNITCLNLGSNDIGPKGCPKLCELISDPNCNLRFFLFGSEDEELFANKMDTDTAIQFAEALMKNKKLICLDLNRNGIGKKNQQAFAAFADVFTKNTQLTTLRFGYTSMSTGAAITMIQVYG